MKKVKKMKKNFLRTSKLSGIVLFVAIIFLLGSAWVGYSYKHSYDQFRNVENNIDSQINMTTDLYSYAVEIKNGDLNKLTQASLAQKNLNQLVIDFKKSSTNDINQNALLQKLQKSINSNAKSLGSINKNKEVLANVNRSVRELADLADRANTQAELLKKSLSQNGVGEMDSQLDNVVTNMNTLSHLTHSLFVNESSDVTDRKISSHIKLYSQLAKGLEEEMAYQGSSAFTTNKEKEKTQLINLINKIPNEFEIIKKSIDVYIESNKHSLELLNLSKTAMFNAKELKSSYSSTKLYPINGIPVGYLSLLIILLGASLILILVWASIVMKDGNRVRMEAIELHAEAEERNRISEEKSQTEQASILRMMDELSALSDGDLTVEMEVTEDFTGAIADSINYSIENMRDMVETITLTSEQVLMATTNTQNIAETLEETSRLQSGEISNSNTIVGRISTSLDDIAQSSDSSAEIAQSSVNIAQDGGERVKRTVKSMWDIRDNIKDTSKRIKRLGESSQEIGDIVEIIKGIADQTNILALNAAIQATSAGEAGKGFAVVADEVQRLAERSGQATKQIETLVKTIQADANEAVASMESSTTQVVNGTAIAEEAGVALDKIERVSNNLSSLISNVSDGTRTAANMAHDVTKNMGTLAKLNEKSVNNVSSSVRSVGMLSDLSKLLKESVAGFKLEESQ